jgi:threonine dehydrogenase-like Zn-dependent dehydrogenase
VVLGDAAIGLCTLQVARAYGARPVGVVGHHDHALAIASQVGADFVINAHTDDPVAAVRDRTGGLGAEVVYESVGGSAPTLDLAAEIVRPGGTIVLIGCFTDPPPPNWRRLMRREVRLLHSWSYAAWEGVPEFQIALDLLAAGRVDLEPLITHRYPLADIQAAFQAALHKGESGAVKVLVI